LAWMSAIFWSVSMTCTATQQGSRRSLSTTMRCLSVHSGERLGTEQTAAQPAALAYF
jgi:hypothetical protein